MKSTIAILATFLGFIQVCAQNSPPDAITFLTQNAPKYLDDANSGGLSQSDLFNDVSPSGYDLLNANISFTDKDQIQKIGFSPVRLLDNYFFLISNARINIANKSGALTSGFSVGNDNSAYESKRVQRMFSDFTANLAALPQMPARNPDETIDQFSQRVAADGTYYTTLKKIALDFDELRLRHVIKYSFGYNAQFFSILESKSTTSNFDSINYHGFKGHNAFLNGSYSFKNGCIAVEGALNYFNKRKTADSLQVKNEYHGFSIGVAKRLVRLLSQQKLETKDFYLNSHFVPSIYLGCSYESLEYQGKNYVFAEDSARRIKVLTPYIDVKVSPMVQFRLAIPIKNSDEYVAGTEGKRVGAVLSFNYKLVNLSN